MKANEKLIAEWREAYKKLCDSEFSVGCDFENFCWGWCVAKGMSLDEAFDFYQEMIALGVF